ncbi:MAG TPA: Uma2 family endonuclease [Thermoanaerobaculia bacterium]
MSAEPHPRMSVAEYLAFERRQVETKNEFLDGELLAMTGASRKHVLLVGNMLTALNPQLRDRGCEVYTNDMRVRIPATNSYLYPDVAIACDPRFEDAEVDTLLNPKVIVEVRSPSTEAYDRGIKFAHYRTLESLTEILLIAQDRVHVEHFARQASDRWLLVEIDDLGRVLDLPSVGARLPLREVYDRVLS